jgi:hypothetical protein
LLSHDGEQFLANLDPKRVLSLDELNERLQAWIDDMYHRTEHSTLGTTPLLRWQRAIEQVRQLSARHRSPPPLLSSPRPAGAPRFHLSAAQPLL